MIKFIIIIIIIIIITIKFSIYFRFFYLFSFNLYLRPSMREGSDNTFFFLLPDRSNSILLVLAENSICIRVSSLYFSSYSTLQFFMMNFVTASCLSICKEFLRIPIIVKVKFPIATTSRCRGGHYSFP